MICDILFSKAALKQVNKLVRKDQERIIAALERIRIRPYSYVKKLVGEQAYRLRVGDYRVIMDIVDDKMIILVLTVGYRRNVYK